ncbi:hypothetical protein, partial [Neisseria gonorrhoeae]|uniref:hypothetical protein n=1 Tax=Neisseria gonorrhoeae TaxID=485 RepID=UPI0011BABC81
HFLIIDRSGRKTQGAPVKRNPPAAGQLYDDIFLFSNIQHNGGRWAVVQEPLPQGALVSLDAKTGAVRALVGGYDFHSKTF